METIIKECSYCGKDVEINHKKRLMHINIFCNKTCEGNFRKKEPNTQCCICKTPLSVKPYILKKTKTGEISCSMECATKRKTKMYLGKKNPNHKKDYDYDCIYNLDSYGAYILGLLWSDGHISKGTISIFQKDKDILLKISNKIYKKDFTKKRKTDNELYELEFNSTELVDFVLSLGGINIGKKSDKISIPNISEELKWPFICGYFDGDGGFKYNHRYPEISIASNSPKMLMEVAKYWGVNYVGKDKIYASGYKALDICGKMYDSTPIKLNRKYEYYLEILNWEPLPNGRWSKEEFFRFKKLHKNSIPPQKDRVTDSGYDVHAIEFEEIDKEQGIYVADMRLAVQPIPGWYFDLIGRSSMPKNNFHFLGGVGVIDRSYVGSLKMWIQKIDKNKPLPKLPFKIAQLIPRKIIHVNFVEVDELSESERGEGGFGSTGN